MNKNDIKRQLINESKVFVPDIKDRVYSSVGYRKQLRQIQFRLKPILTFLVLLLLSLSIFIKPEEIVNSFVIVEINPIVEIEVDQNNKVLAINPLNTDAYFFLENLDIANKTIDEALVAIVNQARLDGYLTDTTGTINVVAANKRRKTETNLNKLIASTLEKHAAKYLRNDDDVKEEAKQNNVSPGRMLIIKKAMAADSSLDLRTALKMDVNELIAIMNNKAKGKIDKFENQYKINLERLEKYKEDNLDELERRKEEIEEKLEILEDLVDEGVSIKEFEDFISLNFPKYDLTISDIDDLENIVEEIEKYYEGLFDMIEDLIEERYETQKDIYKNKVNENSKNDKNDYSLEFESEFPFDKFMGRFKEDEVKLIILINRLNLLLETKFPGVNGRINKLYKEYEELIENVSDNFKNSELILEFEENYNNYKNKK